MDDVADAQARRESNELTPAANGVAPAGAPVGNGSHPASPESVSG
jgi:hypothetical protein